ncbi:MAG: hypothetical protein K5663_08505 [Clostridiales bacterium]|nr:hypothetical protein [Clostridiales bacterium]
MAMKIAGFDDAARQLSRLADGGAIERKCKKAVKAGAETIRAAFREALASQNVSGRSKHQLENSFKIDTVKYDPARGYYTKVYPDGYDDRGEPFAVIANVLEYGRASGKGCYPWQQPTVDRESGNVTAVMAETFEKTE